MSLRDAFKSRLNTLQLRLREHLTRDERIEERGGARGWTPQPNLAGSRSGVQPHRDPGTGSPLADVPHIQPRHARSLAPDPKALAEYEAGQHWDLTAEISALVEAARAAGQSRILLACTLSHCGWSDRVVQALERGADVWMPQAQVAVARAGDRLQKVYFRDLRIGQAEISLPSFPATLSLELRGDQLCLTAVSMDPLGPDPSFDKLKALLRGQSSVPSGSDHFAVVVCSGMMCSRLDASNSFSGVFAL